MHFSSDTVVAYSPHLVINVTFSYLSMEHPSLQRGVRWSFRFLKSEKNKKQDVMELKDLKLSDIWSALDLNVLQPILAVQVNDIFYKNFSLKIVDVQQNQDLVVENIDAPSNFVGRLNNLNLERSVDSRFSAGVFKFYYAVGKNKTQTTTFKIYGIPLEKIKPTKDANISRLENIFYKPIQLPNGLYSLKYRGLSDKYGDIVSCSIIPDYGLLKNIE